MTDKLKENLIDPKLKDWIIPHFSTTTLDDITIASVVFMATMKQYFDYKFSLLCGIPETRIYGNLDDWVKLDKRVKELRKYGEVCCKWADMLEAIIAQFMTVLSGDIDYSFWSRICNHEGGGSGPTYLSGWITAFCVFNEKGQWLGDNKEINTGFKGKKTTEYHFIDMDEIPAGYVTVPVKIDENGTIHESLMFAGHLLIETEDKFTICPKPTWAIVLRPKDESKPSSEHS